MPASWPHSISSDGLIRLGDTLSPTGRGGLVDQLTGAYVNNATVQITDVLDTQTLQRLTGFTPPVSMSYLASSNGVYHGTLGAGVQVAAGQKFLVQILVTTGLGNQRTFFLHAYGVRE